MKVIYSLLTCVLLMTYPSVYAQVKTNFNNNTVVRKDGLFKKGYTEKVDFEIPAMNIDDLLQEEKSRKSASSGETEPFQLAVPVPVNLDLARLIEWKVDNGIAYGKYTIRLNGARSSSINFDKFYLPAGTEMYVYNAAGNMITGPVTEKENNKKGVWGSWVYKDDLLTIEIKTPIQEKDQLVLHAGNIAYGYKDVYKVEVADFNSSAACNINVVCPLGTGWEPERNSVALVLNDNGTSWCSGAAIMNTCGNNRPFFLTANHCYAPSSLPVQDVTAWRFTFQAWSANCTPSSNSNGVTFNGSTLRANWSGSDFCLVELDNVPPANSGIHYAGWNRNTTAPAQTTIIHHPAGDVMKITRDVNTAATSSFLGATCWELHVDNGATEGGTSGAPYFDQNHRIVGQHYGISDGNLPVCDREIKHGGKFDASWTGGGTNSTRLSNWLDPSGSGLTTTNTTNASALATGSLSISGPDMFCTTSSAYTLPGLPATASVTWSTSYSNLYVTPDCAGCTSTTLTKVTDAFFDLTATVSCGGWTSVVTKNNIAAGFPYFSVVPIGNDTALPSANYHYYFYLPPGYPTPTAYTWRVPSGWTIMSGQGTDHIYVQTGTWGTGGPVEVDVTACGLTRLTHKYVEIGWGGGAEPDVAAPSSGILSPTGNDPSVRRLKINPNPAKDQAILSFVKAEAAASDNDLSSIREVRVFDKAGRMLKHLRFNNRQSTQVIPLQDLLSGLYIVSVYDGKSWYSDKLIIVK